MLSSLIYVYFIHKLHEILTLPVPIPNEENKLTYIFICLLPYGASKYIMKDLKAFTKPSEASQSYFYVNTIS